MKLGEKYVYLLKNTFLFTVANFSNKLILFFFLPFYTAYLTTEEYAIIDLISTTQQLIFPIVTLDVTEAVIRFGMEKKSDKASIFTVGLSLIIIGNIILTFVCGLGIELLDSNKTYIKYFWLFSLVISVNTLLSSFLRTIDRVHVITISSIVNTLVTAILNILFIAKLSMGIDGYYIAYIVGNLLAIIIMIYNVQLKSYIKCLEKSEFMAYFLPMMKYAIPLMPNALFWWVNSSLDRYFLTALSTLSYVGMYAAANKIPTILSTLTSIFQQSWGLSIFKENESESKQVFFNNIYNLYNTFVFGISLILIFSTEIISSLLLSKEFFNAWVWIPWLIIGFYSNSISSFIGTEFTAAKRTTLILSTTLISAIVNIVLNFLLIPDYNGLGAAIATAISYFVLLEIRVYVLNGKFEMYINNTKLIMIHVILVFSAITVTKLPILVCIICFIVASILFLKINWKVIMDSYLMIKKFICKKNEYKGSDGKQ